MSLSLFTVHYINHNGGIMKKNKLSIRLAALFAAASMMLPLSSCTGNGSGDDTTGETNTSPDEKLYSSDLNLSHALFDAEKEESEKIDITFTGEDNIDNFSTTGDISIKDDTVTFPANTVTSFSANLAFSSDSPVEYEFTLQCDVNSAPTSATFIGLRLPAPTGGANLDSGVWLAIKGKSIGMRGKNWPSASFVSMIDDISFSTARKLYITDDPTENVITLRVDGDGGEKKEIARYVIEDRNVKLFTPNKETARKKINFNHDIPKGGYMNIWVHHTANPVTVSGFRASGMSDVSNTLIPANMYMSRDNFEDTWVNTDDEGRLTVQDPKNPGEKKVGIFYFMWHDGTSDEPIYDHSAAYYSGGTDKLKEVMKQGPLGFAHYWAEPYFGYYRSDDEWVLRKHANQLTAAGVDFIFFDYTNGLIYERNLEALLKTWNQMRLEGQKVPRVAFNLGETTDMAKNSFSALNAVLFSDNRYEDMWFKWNGKPLVLAPPSFTSTLDEDLRNKFTFKRCWADTNSDWYTETDGKDAWPWADMYPQKPGKSSTGEIEQMIVMCGFWANGSMGTNGGRSYANGVQPKIDKRQYGFNLTYETSGKGLAFEEHFDYAIETDPEVIMITGWNEWWAGRWEGGIAVGQTIAGTYTVSKDDPLNKNYFVDCFNPEYSRDVEPVKGLFNDNYYYQMAQNIRQFKGTRALQTAFGQKTIDMAGGTAQWYSVGPEYRDHVGDTAHRDSMSYVGQLHYTNTTGRNDFINAKVSSDADSFYFMAECAADITSAEGTNWMNLFIDSDASATTGWSGYDYIINRSQNGGKCSIEKFTDGKWELTSAGEADLTLNGKYIVIKIAKSAVSFANTFDFKWADNSVSDGDAMQFVDLGDTAPSDRFNYRFTTETQTEKKPEILTSSMIVLKAGSYNAYVGGKSVMLDSNNTNAVMMGTATEIYLPKAFAKDHLGIDVSSMTTLNHYGTEYVEVSSAISNLGKTVTKSENMIVLSDSTVSENDLLTLYRSLY